MKDSSSASRNVCTTIKEENALIFRQIYSIDAPYCLCTVYPYSIVNNFGIKDGIVGVLYCVLWLAQKRSVFLNTPVSFTKS